MSLTRKLNFKDDNVLTGYLGQLVDNKLLHPNYENNVEQAEAMAVHLKGKHPKEILEHYRPNEPEDVRNYRLQMYEPVTKSHGKRIVNVLSKIQQSSNYSIKFPEQKSISEADNLQMYTEENYPYFGSLVEWAFGVAMQQNLLDANSLVVVMPLVIPDDNISYLKPFTFIYRSDQVLDSGLNFHTILLDEKNVVNDVELNVWLIVTDSQIIKVTQTSPSNLGVLELDILFEYSFGEVPAYFLKGDYREETIPYAYDSFISGIIPHWNKAVRIDSDLDAQYNQHLFLERVEIEVDCDNGCQKDSNDNIFKTVRNGKDLCDGEVCRRCKGSGSINGRSPMGVTSVRKDSLENAALEFPGVVYINKPIEIIELTEKKVALLLSQGFQAINMDIIDKVGENQSGKAKDIDRTELNSFINKISDNLFDNILYNAFRFISLWRYSVVKESVFPTINKPTSFNILDSSALIEEIKMLSEAGVDTTQWELDLIDKKFPNDTEKQTFNKAMIDLDPLAGKKEIEKTDILMAGGVTREQFIVSSNIRSFILDAMEKDPQFLEKTREQKMAKLIELAKKQIVLPIETSDEPTETDTNAFI